MPLEVGHAVWVPFGPRVVQGIVFQLTDHPQVEETRDIIGIVDPLPILSLAQVELARWISERYLSPLFDAAATMMPPGFERRVITFINPAAHPAEDTTASLSCEQRALLNLLQRKGKVAIAEVERALGRKRSAIVIGQLVRKRLVSKTQELERVRVRPKVVPYLCLAAEAEVVHQELVKAKAAPKQAELLQFLLAESRSVPLPEAKGRVGCSPAVVSALRKKGLIAIEQVEVYRDPLAHRAVLPSSAPALTAAQEAAWRQIQAAQLGKDKRQNSEVFLLHGVTGSGKTEIYLRALEQAIALGRRAIVLVPEIALTPQTIDRFTSRFPRRVGVFHSKLSIGEQFDQWWRIKEGAFDVVIGSRGAIFAPQPDLGLIVIDEEHEWAYKQQEQSPRYHARDVAIRLAELTGSVVILGSATPDVTTYYRSQIGDYRLLSLPERIDKVGKGGDSLPQVEIVDLREELRAGNRSIFSRSLARRMKQALVAGEQVILFLNRRGTSTFVQCRHCGQVLRCRRCDVALTYHSAGDDLLCHQCNYRAPVSDFCPRCGSKQIKFLGIGVQRVEQETRGAFPQAKLMRWDRDVTRGKHSHEEILDKFVAHEADVLIGTQMIAKGLDLPQVTLVGVINADIGLHLPDFRASERTFQVLCQVAGRAGRGAQAGHVVVQSYNSEHYAIAYAAKHDYGSFYRQEISLRRQYSNPPFSRLARLLYAHTSDVQCQREAQRMYQLLKEELDSWGMADISFIGPSPAFVQRVRGRFRWQIIFRGDNPARLLTQVPIPQGWIVDIDPVSLL